MSGPAHSPWRARLGLFVVLLALLLANGAVLVAYRLFYHARLGGLAREQASLEGRRDAARSALERATEAERRLSGMQKELDVFHKEVLGTRKEGLASLIEDVYATLRRAGFDPSSVTFGEGEVPGADRLALSFQVTGRYSEIKRLLYAFETSSTLLVVENVGVGVDDRDPDNLRVSITVAHYFHSDAPAVWRVSRATRSSGSPRAPARPASPAEGLPE